MKELITSITKNEIDHVPHKNEIIDAAINAVIVVIFMGTIALIIKGIMWGCKGIVGVCKRNKSHSVDIQVREDDQVTGKSLIIKFIMVFICTILAMFGLLVTLASL